MKEILKLTNDLVFKKFFTYGNDNNFLLSEFLSLVIGRKLEEVEILNPEINDAELTGKQIVMDLRVRTSDALINVEMQAYRQKDYIDRTLLYSTRNFAEFNLKSGDGYINTASGYTINILKHKLFSHPEYMSQYVLKEFDRNDMLSEKFKIFFFELDKVDKSHIDELLITNPIGDHDKLLLWLLLFKCETKGELDMLRTANYATMETATKRLIEISGDEKTRIYAEMREKAQADYDSAMYNQREEGKEEGLAEGKIIVATKLCHSKEELLDAVSLSEQECKEIFERRPDLIPDYWK